MLVSRVIDANTFSLARPACFFTAVANTNPFDSLAMASTTATKQQQKEQETRLDSLLVH
jgi:hypothetical protein